MKRVFGFAGYSGAGKTTLIEKLIPRFTARGLTVSLIKHTHHGFDIDRPGKDSYRHREAGCQEVMVTSNQRWALMHELRGQAVPTLQDHVAVLAPCDVVLVEGYRSWPIPKLEVFRPQAGHPLLFPDDPDIVAVASDAVVETRLPLLDINDDVRIAEFVMGYLGVGGPRR
jgi:molybdopterin-guanine dinucleotide biosynthesis adapter protein